MVTRPVIFVSAVSKELKSARQLVANTLHFLGYEPVWQDIFGSEQGDLREALRKKLDASQGVVHVVGQCYGAEPPVIDSHFGRVSYTQYEALYARQQGRKVWYLLLDDTFATDPHEPESDELRALQGAYRERIRADLLLYHPLENSAALEANVLKLRDELALLRRRGKQWAALVLALLVLTVLGVWLVRNDTGKVKVQTQQIAAGQEQSAKRETDLAAKLGQVQEALSRVQQNTVPKRDPISEWPQERLENELARQMKVEVKDLRAILAAGKTSLDALLQGQALLASGKNREAGEKFDLVIEREKDAMTRLRQAYEGKAQIAFDAVKYEEALEFREKAAAMVDKTADPAGWADAEGWVSFIDLHPARYEHAEPLLKEIVRLREERLGRDDPAPATALNNLAQLYKATNRLAEAEPLMERALKIDEKSFGPEDPKVAPDLNNLAALYQDTNRLAEAEPLMERALKILEKSYGPEHPDVATNLNNLAQLYQATNRMPEAEPLMERVLKIDEKSYGPEHPEVAIDLNNLAQLYQDTNRLAEAEPRLRRAVVILLKSTHAAGHVLPNLKLAATNYRSLLIKMTVPEAEVSQQLAAAGREAGYTPPEMVALLAPFFGPFDVAVTQVLPEGQGPGLGIRVGDIVRRYNGQAITKTADLVKLTGEVKGGAIPLEIQRGDETLQLTAKPGRLGLMLENRPRPPAK